MMHLRHRSAKRLLLTHRISLPGLADAFLPRYLLEEEPVQKNKCARHFSVAVEDHTRETALKNQQQRCLSTDVFWNLRLLQHIHTGVTEERKCRGECLECITLQLAGGATILKSVTHVDDCAHSPVSTCILASQEGDEKRLNFVVCEAKAALQVNHKEGNCCNEGISEFVVADTGTIFHKNNEQRNQIDSITSELAEANCLSKHKEGYKHFDCSASELAIFDPCEASCKDTNKEKDLDSNIRGHALETALTTKFLNKGKRAHTVDDSTSEFFVCMSQNHNANFIREEVLKASLDNIETDLQIEDIRMLRVNCASEVCERDAKTSSNNKAAEGTCSDFCGVLKGVGASEKVDPFRKEQVLVPWPHKVADSAMLKTKKSKNKKRKKKNTNRQFGPEDLKHLSLTPHPLCTATSGQGSCKEKLKARGESSIDAFTCLSKVQSKSISPAARQEYSEYVYSNDSMEALKLKDKEKGGSGDAIFADKRKVNGGMRNAFVEDKQKLFICENSSKSRLHQDQTLGEVSKHMHSTEQSKGGDGEVSKNPSWEVESVKCHDTEHKHRPLLVKKEQAYLNALSHKEVIDKGSSSQSHLLGKWQSVDSTVKPHAYKENEAENEAGDYFFGNKGKIIDHKQLKDDTSLDPPSNFWERAKTLAPVQTIECAVEKAKWDFAGVRKVHYPLKNHRELYIILDLNGVLIKRWDKNPSLPGVCKLNKKWIQLRPGCIEFLHKAFSSFRVGIWSTMTQRNVLNMCNFLEQQAHDSLPFFMLWSKDSCYQHRGVLRPNKGKVVADFKPLSRVWGYFKPYLGFHNTVLVDDSPYKACMNNPYNCIFPDAFEGQTDDKYLNDVLWPYLENMRRSHDIQAYIADNPLGQLPVVVGHELYYHVQQVMDVFDYRASPLRAA